MSVSGTTLKINERTSLADLQKFIADKGPNAKLYGAEVGGEKVLYVKTASTSVVGKINDFFAKIRDSFNGDAKTRRTLAQEGLQQIMQNYKHEVATTPGASKVAGDIEKLIDVYSQQGLVGHNFTENRAHRTDILGKQIGVLQDIYSNLKIKSSSALEYRDKVEMKMESIGLSKNKEASFQGEKRTFPVMIGEPVTVGSLEINGRMFEPVEYLASGGFGDVFRYSDGETNVAVKISKKEANETENLNKISNAVNEVASHQEAGETLKSNSIGFIAAMRLPEDRIVVVTEFADLGTAGGISDKLREKMTTSDVPEEGKIPEKTGKLALLTMIKELGVALRDMHDEGDITHLDVKGANALVTADGTTKLADFGSMRGNERENSKNITIPDAAAYLPPELAVAKTFSEKLDATFNLALDGPNKDKTQNIFTGERGKMKEELSKMFLINSGNNDAVDTVLDNIFSQRVDSFRQNNAEEMHLAKGKKVDTGKLDVWAFGASIVEMMTGKRLVSEIKNAKFGFAGEQHLREFFDAKNISAVAPRGEAVGKHLVTSTGDDRLDEFLNFVLKPRPEDRPTMSEVLAHPYMNQDGIGSQEVKNLIAQIGRE